MYIYIYYGANMRFGLIANITATDVPANARRNQNVIITLCSHSIYVHIFSASTDYIISSEHISQNHIP